MNKWMVLVLSTVVITLANAAEVPARLMTCAGLSTGSWDVREFATQSQRQKNPTRSDISDFYISSVGSTVKGTVKHGGKQYAFTASCKPVNYNNTPELHLIFQADSDSLINGCSGIYTSTQGMIGSAMYLGGRDLITGDSRVSLCSSGAYGIVVPK